MSEETLINDIRNVEEFKGITFSGYKKASVVKQLNESILQGKTEPACYWSAELICSGHFMELWETIINCSSKNIPNASLNSPSKNKYTPKLNFKNILIMKYNLQADLGELLVEK